jgi:cell division septation protein DedD
MRRPSLGAIAGGRRRRRVGAALALLAVIAVVVVVVLDNSSSAPPSAAANASQATGAATVERRNLTETDTEAGTLSYDGPQTVYNRLGGTITWLPQIGQKIKPGGTLYKVDGEPVTLMDGGTPAYRTLAPGITDGADVLELNRNLARLGFDSDGIVVDDVWQAATTVGVELFQESLGETPTGTLTLGQVVFLPGPQLVSTVDGTLGGDGGGGSGAAGSSGTSASVTLAPAQPEFVSLTTTSTTSSATATAPATSTPTTTTPITSPTTTTTTTTTPRPKRRQPARRPRHSETHHGSGRQLGALIELLKAEIAQLKQQHSQPPSSGHGGNGSHGSSSSHNDKGGSNSSSNSSNAGSKGSGGSGGGGGAGGGGGGSASEILQTTSTQLVVTVDLDASLQSEATVGEHVMVELPDGTWVPGKVTAVSAVAQSSSDNSGNNGGSSGGSGPGGGSSGSSATVPVTVTLKGHQSGAGLDQAAVSVNFSKAKAKNVLSVPVTALVATSGSSYAVQEAAAPHKLIPVTTGLFAAGYVEIKGSGIHPGLQVTDSQG